MNPKMGEVKVLGLYSSFPCARVLWALKLKGITYQLIQEDLLNKSPLLLQMNPIHKKVPVLIHNHSPIIESLLILEYIDETWNAAYSLMPRDPYHRSLARFWAKFADEKVVVSVFEAMKLEGEEKEAAVVAAQETLQLLEKQIEGKKFFGGEKMGYLDLVVGWISLWLPAMEQVGGMKLLDSERFPSLCEWTHNFVQVPAIHECLPPKENIVDYFQGGLNYLRSLQASKT
ncbi:probable glutathione S-transferase [Salvia miltiorrhiza]|uniref:probable glutathione S-transferase n=1 Tax=Salvia miltiorrhiza TaxID=226208 RepID=UPI0025AC979A|nr:probable glutathione S-transferase [Salvia miltiorrhiza]